MTKLIKTPLQARQYGTQGCLVDGKIRFLCRPFQVAMSESSTVSRLVLTILPSHNASDKCTVISHCLLRRREFLERCLVNGGHCSIRCSVKCDWVWHCFLSLRRAKPLRRHYKYIGHGMQPSERIHHRGVIEVT